MHATTIHFVRHGKVENPEHLLYERLPGFHLSELGVRMAQATAHYIAISPQLNTVSAVYSSPLERTRETAGEILESLNAVRGLRGEKPLELVTDERIMKPATNSAASASATARGTVEERQLQTRAQPVEAELGRKLPVHRASRAGFRIGEGIRTSW